MLKIQVFSRLSLEDASCLEAMAKDLNITTSEIIRDAIKVCLVSYQQKGE